MTSAKRAISLLFSRSNFANSANPSLLQLRIRSSSFICPASISCFCRADLNSRSEFPNSSLTPIGVYSWVRSLIAKCFTKAVVFESPSIRRLRASTICVTSFCPRNATCSGKIPSARADKSERKDLRNRVSRCV